MTLSASLGNLLAACYRRQTGSFKPGDPQEPDAALATALAADAAMAEEARAYHGSLVDAVTQRCFISRVHKAVIARALGFA